MKQTRDTVVAAALVCASLAVVDGQAPDWPQWRGPNRDASVASFTPPTTWPDRLTRHWSVPVGLGYATPLLVGGRVYVFSRQGENERMAAIDASTGRELWQTSYPAAFTMNSGAARHGAGPKSTPAFSDGRLFAIGMTGVATAFDAEAGRILWQKPASPVAPIFTTHAFSPLVHGGNVVFHLGGHDQGALTALDVATGDVRWQWDGDGPAYASPVLAEIAGTWQIVTLTQRKLVGVDAATGTLLWERPYMTPSVTNAQTPNVLGDLVILGDSGHPVRAYRVAKAGGTWTTDVAWENGDVAMELSDALLHGATLYGLSSRNRGQYFALDAKSGRTLWTSAPRQAAHAAIVRAGDVLFSLEDDGELVVIRASRTAFEPIQRYRVAETDTWTPPVISGNRVFIKDVQSLALWSWSDGPPASDALVHAQAAPGTTPPAAPGVSPDTLLRADILFWESIKDKTDPALFDAYLRQFPNGTFRVLAAARARELRRRPPENDASHALEDDAAGGVIRWTNIPGGRFQMGCVPGDLQCRDDEKPRHVMEVAPFRMMTHDVTVGMFRAHADQGETSMPVQPDWNLQDDQPVVAVSWADAAAFCEARGWRLPTEAEWEYAARGGVDGAIYAWGSKTAPMIDGRPRANVADEAARRRRPGWTDVFAGYDDGFAETSPVGAFPPNAFGLFDMSGNVWRWTSTLARPYPYRADDGREDSTSSDRRVLRGGSWVTGPRGLRLSYRVADDPRDEDDNHGFRCVQAGS